jgi:hypothetical protein
VESFDGLAHPLALRINVAGEETRRVRPTLVRALSVGNSDIDWLQSRGRDAGAAREAAYFPCTYRVPSSVVFGLLGVT